MPRAISPATSRWSVTTSVAGLVTVAAQRFSPVAGSISSIATWTTSPDRITDPETIASTPSSFATRAAARSRPR